MGTLVRLSNASVLDIPHFCDEIAAPELFIKKGRLAHSSGKSRSWHSSTFDNREDFMSSLRQNSVGEECSRAEIGGQRAIWEYNALPSPARVPGGFADFFSTLYYLLLGSIP